MNDQIERILISSEEIDKKVHELAEVLNAQYKGREVVLVCVLKGSVMFYSDLAKLLEFPVIFDFMCVTSYGNSSTSSGSVKIVKDLTCDIKDKDVLMIEDIIDTGNTINQIKNMLADRKPNSLKLCCLLDKPSRRIIPLEADFKGIVIPDEFVVGYGLDYAERFRQLPYIGVLKRCIYEN